MTTTVRRRPLRRKLAFTAITIVGVMVAVEALLAVAGVRPLNAVNDPFVGFTNYSPLFERARTDAGEVYRTATSRLRWFNAQEFPVRKPAGEQRIFVVGGSTVFGRPYEHKTSFARWCEAFLNAGSHEQSWRVINAGGISYASYRVARVVDEIARYQPDYVVIYTGHNEFLEKRTYGELRDGSGYAQHARGLVGRLRAATLLQRALTGTPSTQADPSRRDALPEDVDAILENSVGPAAYRPDSFDRDAVVAHFRFNLLRMVETTRAAGAVPILILPASNKSSCSPFKSESAVTLSTDQRDLLAALAAELDSADDDPERSALTLREMLTIVPDHAGYWYDLADSLVAAGQDAEAQSAYQRALEHDVCPLRATSAIEAAVAEVASATGARMIRFAELLASHSNPADDGSRWFLDHVHPTIEAHRLLGLRLAETFEASFEGIELTTAALSEADSSVRGEIDSSDHAIALKNLAKVLGWAGKSDEADAVAARAAAILTTDAEAQYLDGARLLRGGDVAKAEVCFRAAIAADSTYPLGHYGLGLVASERGDTQAAHEAYREAYRLDPDQPQVIYNLARATAVLGDRDRAETLYREAIESESEFAEAYHNLGVLLAETGRPREACAVLLQAHQLSPRNADMHFCYAQALEASGDPQRAAEHYRQILRDHAGYKFAAEALSRVVEE